MIRLRLAPILLPALAALAAAQDPFSAEERWFAGPAPGEVWLPEDVTLAGDASFVWTARSGTDGGLFVYDAVARGTQGPRGKATDLAGSTGVPLIASGTRGDAVFSLRQVEAPTIYSRAPIVQAFDPRGVSAGGTMAPLWEHDLGVRINGSARLVADRAGDTVVAAAWDNATAQVRLDLLDGTTGALIARDDLPGLGLSALAISADGSRIAAVCGLNLYVLDARNGLGSLHSEVLNSSTQALALSANGLTLAHGAIGSLRVLQDLFGGYAASGSVTGSSTELPSRVALSDDGGTAAIGWWDYTNAPTARLEIFDLIFGFAFASEAQNGPTNGFQNLPQAVRITPDGRRAAFGMWGNGVDAQVVMLEAGSFAPVASLPLAGSVRGLALDPDGTRLAIGHKETHNQNFSARGSVRLYDTGERMLQLQGTPRVGGSLDAVAMRAGSNLGWFVIGPKAAAPQTFPGTTGALLLQRGRLQINARPVDSAGRMDFSLPLPNSPALRGLQLHVQAAFRTTQGLVLSPNLVSPYILD